MQWAAHRAFEPSIRPLTITKTKHLFAAAFAAFLGFTSAFAGGEGWTHDLVAAKKQAADERKDLLLDFTGSDWCPSCIELTNKVLSREEFRNLTKDKFVLVELDFPRKPESVEEQSAVDKARNAKLASDYGIQAFPTIILAYASGKPYAYTGIRQGGPENYAGHLDELREQGAAMKVSIESAAKSDGVEKAKALIAALGELPEKAILTFYPDIADQIKAADPKGETGFSKKLAVKAQMAEFEKGLQVFGEKSDMEGALAYVERGLAEDRFEGDNKQQVLMTKAGILAGSGKFDDAIKAIDDAKAAAPGSEMAARFDDFKAQLEQARKEAGQKEEATK